MSSRSDDRLGELRLMPFQEDTARYAYRRIFNEDQQRFLVADEVGLGKTKVALGVIAQAMARRAGNVLYIAPSMHITRQNLSRLEAGPLRAQSVRSLCLESQADVPSSGVLLGLTPTKDLHADHEGDYRERALILRILEREWPALQYDSEIQALFRRRVNPARFENAKPSQIPRALRVSFLNRVDSHWLTWLDDPGAAKKNRRTIIGGMRAVLARHALEKLKPSLIVVDEFQRMTKEFLGNEPTPQVKYLLGRRLLVLSATPYDPGSLRQSTAQRRHEAFLELVSFLNPGSPSRADDIRAELKELAGALQEHAIDRARVEAVVGRLGALQRPFMVRTERPPQAQVRRERLTADLTVNDLDSLTASVKLVQRLTGDGRGKAQVGQLIELWKSIPYPLSTIDHNYVTGRLLSKGASPRNLRHPAALSKAQLQRKQAISEPVNARLRSLLKELGDDAQPRLWLPPTIPYIQRQGGGGASKTLVFTSWSAAPAAIAATMNLVVEPAPRRGEGRSKKSRLELYSNRLPTKSTYLLAAPLVRLAKVSGCDALHIARSTDHPPTPSEMVAEATKALMASGLVRPRGRRLSDRQLVDTVLDLDAFHHWSRRNDIPGRGWAHEVMSGAMAVDSVGLFAANARFVAELASAAPGTCAYRSLKRVLPGLTENEAREAAFRIGYAITRLFGRPGSWPVVGTAGLGPDEPYWKRVLRYCRNHDLQSVLDEYVSLLVRDAPGENPAKAAKRVSETVHVAMRTTGRLRVTRPAGVFGTAQFARALGEKESEDDKDLEKGKGAQKASPLLTAFNSPFPPFMLTTTSTGQEGLDMHRYCRRIVHWNLPQSPQAMEQREGRVDRFLSLGVRTAIGEAGLTAAALESDPWEDLINAAKESGDASSVLSPLWHFGDEARIRAVAVVIPFSREESWWEELKRAASWYRLVLGQPDPEALLDRLSRSTSANHQAIVGLGVDLRPPAE